MELLNETEIKKVVKQWYCEKYDSLEYNIENYSDEIVGHLGEHLSLKINVYCNNTCYKYSLFVKCIPRFDHFKAEYLRETKFFAKEFTLLNSLFTLFKEYEGNKKWRPKPVYLKEEVFVFEDVTQIGYTMRDPQTALSFEDMVAAVEAAARFHAQSFIFEHKKSKELKRPYSIWENYSVYLVEPTFLAWRDAGKHAVIDFLKTFSAYRNNPGFSELLADRISLVFNRALDAMKPSNEFRNVVIHRDLWSNNIFFKRLESGKLHALIVDFQTALYSTPTHDLTSMMYFNTSKEFRTLYSDEVQEYYYSFLQESLACEHLSIGDYIPKEELGRLYEASTLFGIVQAALIVPITHMSFNKIKEYCDTPEKNHKFNSISRSDCFIEFAKENVEYRNVVIALLDEIVERYVLVDQLNDDAERR
ncbi:uncharacterized protein LOC126977408 [Leptidea sinapis]|uniref:uncharacterized protein LOC126977408 n=1 Tax=Leptidea sinapis TaxID=189913 RepID=UPI0021C2BF61|nr:uncharacterized protein LOC126977408 [Leptidea sinapis]